MSGDGIVAIEWAERWSGRPDDVTEVRIEDAGEDRRRIRIKRDPPGKRGPDATGDMRFAP